MKAYLEVKDILSRTKHGTKIYLIDLVTDTIEAGFVLGKYDYEKNLPRELIDGEPFDIIVEDSSLTIVVSKDNGGE